MEKIPPISSLNSPLSESILNANNAKNAFNGSFREFNIISSRRHLKLNMLFREHFDYDSQEQSIDTPKQLRNLFFNSNNLEL